MGWVWLTVWWMDVKKEILVVDLTAAAKELSLVPTMVGMILAPSLVKTKELSLAGLLVVELVDGSVAPMAQNLATYWDNQKDSQMGEQ